MTLHPDDPCLPSLGGTPFAGGGARGGKGSEFWVSLDEPERERRGYIRNLRDAFARGLDIYAVMFDRCREKGVSPWLSFRMNDIHGTRQKANPMHSTFGKERPEWHVGDDNGWENGLDHAQEPVRARMLALMREALERYDADGVELDIIPWAAVL